MRLMFLFLEWFIPLSICTLSHFGLCLLCDMFSSKTWKCVAIALYLKVQKGRTVRKLRALCQVSRSSHRGLTWLDSFTGQTPKPEFLYLFFCRAGQMLPPKGRFSEALCLAASILRVKWGKKTGMSAFGTGMFSSDMRPPSSSRCPSLESL